MNTGSGGTVLTGLPMLMGATSKVGGISWVVGAVYRTIQGRYGADGIVLSVLELKLDRSWRLVFVGTAIARVWQSIVMKGQELQQKARLLYEA